MPSVGSRGAALLNPFTTTCPCTPYCPLRDPGGGHRRYGCFRFRPEHRVAQRHRGTGKHQILFATTAVLTGAEALTQPESGCGSGSGEPCVPRSR